MLHTAGGSLLKSLGSLVGAKGVDWARWHIFFGDERNVPHSSEDSTIKGAREAFLGRVPIPAAQVHAIAEGLSVEVSFDKLCCGPAIVGSISAHWTAGRELGVQWQQQPRNAAAANLNSPAPCPSSVRGRVTCACSTHHVTMQHAACGQYGQLSGTVLLQQCNSVSGIHRLPSSCFWPIVRQTLLLAGTLRVLLRHAGRGQAVQWAAAGRAAVRPAAQCRRFSHLRPDPAGRGTRRPHLLPVSQPLGDRRQGGLVCCLRS